MQTVEIQIFKFNELSETAKEKAREWYRRGMEFHFADEYLQTIIEGCEAFSYSFDRYSIDFDSPSRSEWRAENSGDESELSGNRLRTYLVNNFWRRFAQPKKYGKRVSRITMEKTDCPFTGMYADEVFMDVFRAFLAKPTSQTFSELIEEAIEAVIHAGAKEWEFQQSNEAVDEEIELNEYDFEEDGTKF